MQRWSSERQAYEVPAYTAPEDTSWFHFLHGNVPHHQIDFIYRPAVPHGKLSQQHFSHLSRLMKYIEPQTYGGYAFCIGNLSRDDIQYEPGHGALTDQVEGGHGCPLARLRIGQIVRAYPQVAAPRRWQR